MTPLHRRRADATADPDVLALVDALVEQARSARLSIAASQVRDRLTAARTSTIPRSRSGERPERSQDGEHLGSRHDT